MHGSEKIRIAVDGAQSTGKTTLVGKLAERYGDGFSYLDEAAIVVAPQFSVQREDDWAPLIRSPGRLQAFFDAEERAQRANERSARSFVADGSRLLIWAYRQHFLAPTPIPAPTYDLILFCGIESEFTSDGFRFAGGREAVDRLYRASVFGVLSERLVELPAWEMRYEAAFVAVDRLLEQRRKI